jgi:hypothetical protein
VTSGRRSLSFCPPLNSFSTTYLNSCSRSRACWANRSLSAVTLLALSSLIEYLAHPKAIPAARDCYLVELEGNWIGSSPATSAAQPYATDLP